jgi:hypothetical protein
LDTGIVLEIKVRSNPKGEIMKTRWIVLTAFLALTLAGCGQAGEISPMEPRVPSSFDAEAPSKATPNGNGTPIPASTSQEFVTPDRINDDMVNTPERVPPTEEIQSVTGEVPSEILDPILQDLAGRTGETAASVIVIQAQEVIWNDGSLGCPEPGVMYTQALVNGYWIILEVAGKKFDYRAAKTGYFTLCENGVPPVPVQGTPDS